MAGSSMRGVWASTLNGTSFATLDIRELLIRKLVQATGFAWADLKARTQFGAMPRLLDDGYLTGDSHVWCEGRTEWKKLRETDDLKYLTDADEGDGRPKKARRAMAPGTELEALDAELAAMRAEKAAKVGVANADGGDEGAGSRPVDAPDTPEELEFEDDDGTVYVWDKRLRKYMPKEGHLPDKAAPAPEDIGYDIDAMTYQPEEEVIPSLAEARAAEAEAQADEAQKRERKKAGQGASTSDPKGDISVAAATANGADGAGKAAAASAAAAAAADKRKDAQGAAAGRGTKRPAEGEEGATSGNGGDDGGEEDGAAASKSKKANKGGGKKDDKQSNWFDLKINTNVYVTGLPLDVTVQEINEVFSKCGIVKVDEKGHPRIKLYKWVNGDKATGLLKGDALVSYLKEPSVELACRFLHQSQFRSWRVSLELCVRPGSGPLMTVEPAKFEMKGETYKPKVSNKKEKKKQLAQLEQRALGWGGFDDKAPPEKTTAVLSNMFATDDFLENMLLAGCTKLGTIEKVRIFKHNPQGIVTVRFRTPEAAHQCVALMNGRYFGGRQLHAFMWDGFTNYNVKPKETPEEEQARLEAFARELEAKGETAAAAAASAAAAAAAGKAAEAARAAEAPKEEEPQG
ncbi:hypothetical protein VOLCADRAFT_91952 [Volvox carteri f. nagariensis]|uniref:RRM domain-containing protein n=1 Tax=Volvox carteri f. nagariensis TaxID=3068 RepID=D8TYE0_VOLCA|nr:uncharacterized protein VOLCADRAFT_91952 [Volvox carteri f. nagariensis]EFJ47624.1 hypothetical protein VOLCADRAFT_91952 [Volvox carteri f. nagariensis]|eukprot:XP_002951448.1 hypothetical protein VOLCADRAFT_91952 [Volvox carteri f. nagariensis]